MADVGALLARLIRRPAWQADALCRGVGPERFFPSKGGDTLAPRDLCGRCPVELDCLSHALANRERFGVWGGKTERHRKRILAERREHTGMANDGDAPTRGSTRSSTEDEAG